MCLAIPGKIKSIELQHNGLVRMAKVSFGGITKEASLEMLPDAKIDDYVLVHVGVAISKVNEEEAKKTFKYLEEIGELGELEDVEDYLPEKLSNWFDISTYNTLYDILIEIKKIAKLKPIIRLVVLEKPSKSLIISILLFIKEKQNKIAENKRNQKL